MELTLSGVSEHGFVFVSGLLLVLFGVLNARYDLTRQVIKGFGVRLFGAGAGRRVIDEFADTRFGRFFYRQLATIFALFIGMGWLLIGIEQLISDLRR